MVQTKQGAVKNLWLSYLGQCVNGYQAWLAEHHPEEAHARQERIERETPRRFENPVAKKRRKRGHADSAQTQLRVDFAPPDHLCRNAEQVCRLEQEDC